MLPASSRLIGVRQIAAGTARIPVLLFKNEGGSVAGRLLLGDGDEPVLDGATAQAVLLLIGIVLPWALLARGRRVR